jgi:DNA gyrase subunit A
MGGEQKFKEGDGLRQSFQTTSGAEIMFFTDRCQVYKTRLSEFDDTKASVLGDYLPAKLGMDSGENVIYAALPGDYSGFLLFLFENGKAARVPLSSYGTKSNRRRLSGAYSDKSPLVSMLCLTEETEIALYSTEPRCLLFHTSMIPPKASRSAQGVNVMALKAKHTLERALPASETPIANAARYRAKALPSAGALLRQEDTEEKQLSIM